ncbi:hypothetical protein ACQEUX_10900 [Micromonospora sp. CA-259024]|uniref:hypothetical protein n=1 Tax=Micromonospora sp. CA-259024 TaxID=3239965 RepID=UPI003D8BC5B8
MSDSVNWTGGFYELLLILGATDDARLDRAVRALWRAADVRECRVGPDLVEVAPGADWRAPLDRWLADIAVAVYDDAPFGRAIIGFEVDEDADITAGKRYAARVLPGTDSMDYYPATT